MDYRRYDMENSDEINRRDNVRTVALASDHGG